MAKFAPKTFDYNSINNGNRFENGDGVPASAINAPIEAAALMQSLATNSPDVTQANKVGTPTVEIGGTESNPRFVFKHLKGETGKSGLDYGASISNQYGNSDTDGYTQQYINSLIINPNLLINGDFVVNQRGITQETGRKYFVDMWLGSRDNVSFSVNKNEVTIASPLDNNGYIKQFVEWQQKIGTVVTLSANVTAISGGARIQLYGRLASGSSIQLGYAETTNTGVLSLTVSISEEFTALVAYIGASIGSTATYNYAKLELGSVATPFEARPISQELDMCYRYYYRASARNSYPYACFGLAFSVVGEKKAFTNIELPTAMRILPTFNHSGTFRLYNGNSYTVTDLSKDQSTNKNIAILISSSTQFTSNNSMWLSASNDESAYIEFDACMY